MGHGAAVVDVAGLGAVRYGLARPGRWCGAGQGMMEPVGVIEVKTLFLRCDVAGCPATIGPANYIDQLLTRAADAAWSVYADLAASFGYSATCPRHDDDPGRQGRTYSQDDVSGELESSWGGSQEEQ